MAMRSISTGWTRWGGYKSTPNAFVAIVTILSLSPCIRSLSKQLQSQLTGNSSRKENCYLTSLLVSPSFRLSRLDPSGHWRYLREMVVSRGAFQGPSVDFCATAIRAQPMPLPVGMLSAQAPTSPMHPEAELVYADIPKLRTCFLLITPVA